ncbi:MAG: hypothetical protein P4L99_17220 [Chthoniobacter sp.]|nr:hypothetical protein [Chthoniobacter sp.]
MNKNPCLLSEFQPICGHDPKQISRLPKTAALVGLGLGILALILAFAAKTALLSIIFSVLPETGNEPLATYKHLFGFLAEPNWGPFFIVIFPFCILFGLQFLLKASEAITALDSKILKSKLSGAGSPTNVTETVSRANQAIFGLRGQRGALLLILVWFLIFSWCLVTQTASLLSTENYKDENFWDFGQTQSPNLGEWEKHFNGKKSEQERIALLEADHHADSAVFQLGTKFKEAKDPGSKLRIVVATAPKDKPEKGKAYLWYLLGCQALVALLFTFVLWIAIKGLLFWGIIICALFQKCGLVLEPKMDDATKNYGLGQLQGPTTKLFFFCACLAVYVLLKTSNTMSALPLLYDDFSGAQGTLIVDLVALIAAPFLYFFIPRTLLIVILHSRMHPGWYRTFRTAKPNVIALFKEVVGGGKVVGRSWAFNTFMSLYMAVLTVIVVQALLLNYEKPIEAMLKWIPRFGDAAVKWVYGGGIKQDKVAIVSRSVCWWVAERADGNVLK